MLRSKPPAAHALLDAASCFPTKKTKCISECVSVVRSPPPTTQRDIIGGPCWRRQVDNVRAVHGRSPFAPRFDGQDRFIIRSFAIRDLVRTRYARPAGTRTHSAEYS